MKALLEGDATGPIGVGAKARGKPFSFTEAIQLHESLSGAAARRHDSSEVQDDKTQKDKSSNGKPSEISV
ncbi:hypothetical protein TTRE_0000946201 [Trichuris trichiura]|uniref:Uncharacterized protein n=1 Tax=Trichuris trichiura TaxID=36087 RepID=A0A077ZMR7_TRITR|nr:hypothetical protein TTRE_0000946201 [Trichuris trichiura]